jgi:hypothetical protein
MDEENRAKQMLARLEELGPDAPEFDAELRRFEREVLAHAQREEREEFPGIRRLVAPTSSRGWMRRSGPRRRWPRPIRTPRIPSSRVTHTSRPDASPSRPPVEAMQLVAVPRPVGEPRRRRPAIDANPHP